MGARYTGPFSKTSSSRKFLQVVTNYFTKWVEVVPLVNISYSNVKDFLLENIITRLGIPKMLVSNNGSQFKSQKVAKFCEKQVIRLSFF